MRFELKKEEFKNFFSKDGDKSYVSPENFKRSLCSTLLKAAQIGRDKAQLDNADDFQGKVLKSMGRAIESSMAHYKNLWKFREDMGVSEDALRNASKEEKRREFKHVVSTNLARATIIWIFAVGFFYATGANLPIARSLGIPPLQITKRADEETVIRVEIPDRQQCQISAPSPVIAPDPVPKKQSETIESNAQPQQITIPIAQN